MKTNVSKIVAIGAFLLSFGLNSVAAPPVAPKFRGPVALNLSEIQHKIGYPAAMAEAHVEGYVTLKVEIDEKGRPVSHKIVQSDNVFLTQACLEKLYDLRFEPALENGKPVYSTATIPFHFKLG